MAEGRDMAMRPAPMFNNQTFASAIVEEQPHKPAYDSLAPHYHLQQLGHLWGANWGTHKMVKPHKEGAWIVGT